MKKWFVFLAVLTLASCIDVDDFGAYWDKADIDPALQGDWLRVPISANDAANDFPTGQIWHFTLKDGAYSIQTHLDGKTDDDPLYPVKTLPIGHYRFLAAGPKHGSIGMYKIEDDKITLYGLNFITAWEYIKKKYPDTSSNFVRSHVKDAPMKIKLLDDNTYKILSELPDDGRFWNPGIILQRINPTDQTEPQ